ncbi:MAG: hypothetical protein LBS89_01260, partial [Zoogloeaceae bacterium]|nr:hypothetical protein [Zoogloeaceae bacterium]
MLATGERIIEHLKTACPSVGGHVFAMADLAEVEEAGQIAPALHVILHSYAPPEVVGRDVRWDVVW